MHKANRLDHIEEYYFSNKMRELNTLLMEGKPLINLGIGNPDLPPPSSVKKALRKSAKKDTTHGYQSYKGLPEFRDAVSAFYKKTYQVSIDSDREVLPLFGSKEGIMHISMALLNKNDKVLIPNPGYSTYASVTRLVEAEPVFYDLNPSNHWHPDLKEIEQYDLTKVKIMWVNYPNMPTGGKATIELFEQLIAFGKKHNILIINDNPYSLILTNKPLSILQVNGAKDTAVELNSLSKSFNMAGWRIGMLVGNQTIIEQTLKVKSNVDSGMFYGLQMGGIAAMRLGNDWFEKLDQEYLKRRLIVREIVEKLGWTYEKESEGFFVWAKIPEGQDDTIISDNLLKKYHVFVTPGSIFGSNGKGYLRFSLCVNQKVLKQVFERVSAKLF